MANIRDFKVGNEIHWRWAGKGSKRLGSGEYKEHTVIEITGSNLLRLVESYPRPVRDSILVDPAEIVVKRS